MVSTLAHPKIKSAQDLSTEPTLLGFNHLCAYRNRLTDWVKQDGVVAKVVEISSYHALLSCVAAGMGVGIVPKALLEQYPFAHNIKMHPLPAKWRHSTTAIIWRKDSVKPSMTAFAKCLFEKDN